MMLETCYSSLAGYLHYWPLTRNIYVFIDMYTSVAVWKASDAAC